MPDGIGFRRGENFVGRLPFREAPSAGSRLARTTKLFFRGGDDSLGGPLDERRQHVLAVRLGFSFFGLRHTGLCRVRRFQLVVKREFVFGFDRPGDVRRRVDAGDRRRTRCIYPGRWGCFVNN